MTLPHTLHQAEDIGYFVTQQSQSRHEDMGIRCAGTLEECIEYIRGRFTEIPLDAKPGSISIVEES